MLKSAVTISLVREAEGGPFVFWHDLEAGCRQAAELGYDAVEIFAPSPQAVNASELKKLLSDLNLKVAAVGTGAGWVIHRLTLTSPDGAVRQRAKDFIRSIIDFGAEFQTPAIIGSMQGRSGDGVTRETALDWLGEACGELGEHAGRSGVPLIYEPLNRYETNLINRVADGVEFLKSRSIHNVVLLADLFHMNIEEVSVPEAIRAGAGSIGHVHFVDSNRRPAGCGHTDFKPIIAALRETGYDRYLSAEAFAWPDPTTAARQTIAMFRSLTSGT